MPVKIKEIKGALVKEQWEDPVGRKNWRVIGFNQAITQQGEIAIGMNRERLAKRLVIINWPQPIDVSDEYYECFVNSQIPSMLPKADAIIKELPTLLEVVK